MTDFLASIWIAAPVLGLRPTRAGVSFGLNVTKPGIATESLFFRVVVTVLDRLLRTVSTVLRSVPVLSEIDFTRSE